MDFSSFSKAIYPHLSGFTNQSWYVGALFTAAGSKFFPERPEYASDSYQVKLFNGSKKISKKIKASFPKPINRDSVIAFFVNRIGDESLSEAMAKFSFPEGTHQNKLKFSTALCEQFEAIVTEVGDNAPDIIVTSYQGLTDDVQISEYQKALFDGDDFLIDGDSNPQVKHGFYEVFDFTWLIINNGSVIWNGRTLEPVQLTPLKTNTPIVQIPSLKPGEKASLTIELDTRGDERGSPYEVLWAIRSNDGIACFPNKDPLRLTVEIVNERNESIVLSNHDISIIDHIKSVIEIPQLYEYLRCKENNIFHKATIDKLFHLAYWYQLPSNKCMSDILDKLVCEMLEFIETFQMMQALTFFWDNETKGEYRAILDNNDKRVDFVDALNNPMFEERLLSMNNAAEKILVIYDQIIRLYNAQK